MGPAQVAEWSRVLPLMIYYHDILAGMFIGAVLDGRVV